MGRLRSGARPRECLAPESLRPFACASRSLRVRRSADGLRRAVPSLPRGASQTGTAQPWFACHRYRRHADALIGEDAARLALSRALGGPRRATGSDATRAGYRALRPRFGSWAFLTFNL